MWLLFSFNQVGTNQVRFLILDVNDTGLGLLGRKSKTWRWSTVILLQIICQKLECFRYSEFWFPIHCFFLACDLAVAIFASLFICRMEPRKLKIKQGHGSSHGFHHQLRSLLLKKWLQKRQPGKRKQVNGCEIWLRRKDLLG